MSVNLSVFFEEQVTNIIAEVERVQYAKKSAREILPFDAKASRGAQVLKQYVLDRAGIAKLKQKLTDKLELVDVSSKSINKDLYVSESGFQYNYDELLAAQEGTVKLDAEKARAVKETYEEMINRVAFVGQDDLGLEGFANCQYVSTVSDMGANFSVATSEQRVSFFTRLCGKVYSGSGLNYKADTLVIPALEYIAMGEKTFTGTGVVTDKTELEVLQDRLNAMYGSVKILPALELEGLGLAGTQRAVAFYSDPSVLYFEETIPLEYRPIQEVDNFFKVPTFSKVGGVFIRRPYGIQYGDYTK